MTGDKVVGGGAGTQGRWGMGYGGRERKGEEGCGVEKVGKAEGCGDRGAGNRERR